MHILENNKYLCPRLAIAQMRRSKLKFGDQEAVTLNQNQKVRELYVCGVFGLGLTRSGKGHFWCQVRDDSPDAFLMQIQKTDAGNKKIIYPVEVCEFGPKSSKTLNEILSSKLAIQYDSGTMLIVYGYGNVEFDVRDVCQHLENQKTFDSIWIVHAFAPGGQYLLHKVTADYYNIQFNIEDFSGLEDQMEIIVDRGRGTNSTPVDLGIENIEF